MSIFNWNDNWIDNVIDAVFILTELKDINLTDKEKGESAYFDSLANKTNTQDDDSQPVGKRVY